MRTASEEGFTLVELMASLTILAVGIVGVIGVMNSAFRVAGTTSARSRGVGVATLEIERLRAIPYGSLALTIVDYDKRTQEVGGRDYTVKSAVTEETEATGPEPRTPKAYKKAFVWVSWQDESGSHDVYQTTFIYPGGEGLFNAADSVAAVVSGGAPNPPTALVAVAVANTTGVDLVWTPPVIAANVPPPASWVVQLSKDPTFPQGQIQEVASSVPGGVSTLRVDDLATATYYFRVFSRSSDGKLSTTAAQSLAVTTNASLSVVCSVGTASVTPSAIKKKSSSDGSALSSNPRVEISTLGICTGLSFRMEYSPRTDVLDDVALSGSSGSYSGVVAGTGQIWEVGEHDIDVYSYTTAGTKTKRATLRLIVCDHSKLLCP